MIHILWLAIPISPGPISPDLGGREADPGAGPEGPRSRRGTVQPSQTHSLCGFSLSFFILRREF